MDGIRRGRRLWRVTRELERIHTQEVGGQVKVEERRSCFVSRLKMYW